MIKLDGMNVPKHVKSITINGAWVSATINGAPMDVRDAANANWYDEKHRRVVRAMEELEQALTELLS